VDGVGGASGNGNTLTFTVSAARSGVYAMRVRYANPEQAEATHYNPRSAGTALGRVDQRRRGEPGHLPHSFHRNNFWELTVPVTLRRNSNTIAFSSAELPNFDGVTYASDTLPGILLRSAYAPLIDRIALTPLTGPPPR
jgi:hypothetical protein